MKIIPIFFTFNNDYSIPAAVAFFSLLEKAKDGIFYEMYVLHSDITDENQKLLQDIVTKQQNGHLTFIHTESFLDSFWNNGNFEENNYKTQFTVDTIVRCFSSRFFPQYEKIIYSDVDIVVVDDISELYNIDLADTYIGAVKNPFMKFDPNELSHLKPEHYEMLKDSYFGGGIWVLNLKKIREDNLEEKCFSVLTDDTIIKRWNDQDIMNIACENKVTYIKMNYISLPYMDMRVQDKNFSSHYSSEELYDSFLHPKIIHFAGVKPWNNHCNKCEYWWEIFHYLNLPFSRIITRKSQDDYSSLTGRLQKKNKKYKKRYIAVCVVLAISLALNIFSFFN